MDHNTCLLIDQAQCRAKYPGCGGLARVPHSVHRHAWHGSGCPGCAAAAGLPASAPASPVARPGSVGEELRPRFCHYARDHIRTRNSNALTQVVLGFRTVGQENRADLDLYASLQHRAEHLPR